jgi:hypothetical protein
MQFGIMQQALIDAGFDPAHNVRFYELTAALRHEVKFAAELQDSANLQLYYLQDPLGKRNMENGND